MFYPLFRSGFLTLDDAAAHSRTDHCEATATRQPVSSRDGAAPKPKENHMTLVVQTQGTVTADGDEPLLSYTVSTTPSPLKASPENPQVPEEIGEVIITVARQSGTPADVEWIRVKVPAGTMAPDLATDLNKITPRITLTGWTARLDEAAKEFVFSPRGSHEPIGPDTGFTIQLSDIPMSRKVGTAPITITENSREAKGGPEQDKFEDRETVFNLGKFPADFYLRNFLSTPLSIPNGGDVKLTWERSANATYELLYGDVNRDVTNRTSLDIEGIKSDTTFYLRGTTGDPTNPVVRILSAQVSVIKPDLNVGNVMVNHTLDVGNSAPIASTNMGYAEDEAGAHRPANMFLDGRYYKTGRNPEVDDWVQVDLNSDRAVTLVRIEFNPVHMDFRPPRSVVEYSTNGADWISAQTIVDGTYTVLLPVSWNARYVRWRVLASKGAPTVINNFRVQCKPAGVVITPASTTIHAPLNVTSFAIFQGSVRIVGDLTVTGNIVTASDTP
ncbi:discoidin domain-containing protein [Streptomyces goshikiensis]|uniref:discoidin domain-containing protein n=1 Tax=Streptomyces goshikiensis TaxID=1942 RepID=UPI003655B00C